MVKAPTPSRFAEKFKPWRKGKSTKAAKKSGGSLKHQLRGLERLLGKCGDDATRRATIQASIDDLKQQIEGKEVVERERANAKKSHGARFLDRQRLVRLWQQTTSQKSKNNKQELYRIGLDMIYVAHFPHSALSYLSIFSTNKKRNYPRGRALAKLVSARQKIFAHLYPPKERASWVPSEVYDEMSFPSDWSVKLEKETFDYSDDENATDKKKKSEINDDRFAADSKTMEDVLKAADAAEADLDQEEEDDDSNEDDDDDDDEITKDVAAVRRRLGEQTKKTGSGDESSSDEEADPLEHLPKSKTKTTKLLEPPSKKKKETAIEKEEEQDEDDSSSSSDEEEHARMMKKLTSQNNDSSSSDSSSSDNTDSDDDDDDKKVQTSQKDKQLGPGGNNKRKLENVKESKKHENAEDAVEEPKKELALEEEDGFLVAADDTAADLFAKAKQHVPERTTNRGDKSQGWSTQRQKPGQFKQQQSRGGQQQQQQRTKKW